MRVCRCEVGVVLCVRAHIHIQWHTNTHIYTLTPAGKGDTVDARSQALIFKSLCWDMTQMSVSGQASLPLSLFLSLSLSLSLSSLFPKLSLVSLSLSLSLHCLSHSLSLSLYFFLSLPTSLPPSLPPSLSLSLALPQSLPPTTGGKTHQRRQPPLYREGRDTERDRAPEKGA